MFSSKSSTPTLLPSAAFNTPSGTVLDQLDALVVLRKPNYRRLTIRNQDPKLKKKTKEEEEEEKRFIAAVNQILVQVPRDKIHTVWLRLFAERMHSSQTLTTPQQMEHYMNVFTDWLEVVPPSEANSVNRKLALAFLSGFASYVHDPLSRNTFVSPEIASFLLSLAFRTHSVDPDNSVIGLQASEKAVTMALKFREEQQAEYDSYSKLLRLEPGDLCLVKKMEKFMWARISKVLPGSKMAVYFDPLETDSETINSTDAYPLGDQLASNTGSVKLQEKIIFSPAEDFFTQLNTEIRNRSGQFLTDQGVNLPLLRRLSRNEFVLSDLPTLKQVRTQLQKLLDTLENTEFFKSIKSWASQRVAAFLADLKPETLFPPTRNRVLEHLKVTQFSALAKVDIQKYIAVCDSTLDLITLERRKLMSGETKNYLTEWWLHLIRDEVERWLTEQGYDHEAVPYNYIEQAPTSLDICRKNLQLLQGILSTLSDKTQPVHVMIVRLKSEIYPKIDEFIEKYVCRKIGIIYAYRSQLVICEHLGIESTGFTPIAARQSLEAKQKDGSLKDPPLVESLSNLILDLEYLKEMKHLEDHPPTAGGLKLGVVPISGVIVGYFYRYENELITVLDVWGGGVQQPATPAPPAGPSMIEQSLAAVARTRAPSIIDAANLTTDNAYLSDNLKREQISFLRLSSMNISERKEFISEQHSHNQLRRTPQDDIYRSRALSDAAEDQQISALMTDFVDFQAKQLSILKHMCERDEFNRATIRKLRTELARIQEREFSSAATAIAANPTKRVVLNVGGTKYTTTVDTFAREPESQLAHLVGAARFDTEVFIDRDGAVFAHVLNYLRDGSISGNSEDLKAQLLREAKFFGLLRLQSVLDGGKLSPKLSLGSVSPSSSSTTSSSSKHSSHSSSHKERDRDHKERDREHKDKDSGSSKDRAEKELVVKSAAAATTNTGVGGRSNTTVVGGSALPRTDSAARSQSIAPLSPPAVSDTPASPNPVGGSMVIRSVSEAGASLQAAAAGASQMAAVPAAVAKDPVALHWYLFLSAAQVPEDACVTYAGIFMEKKVQPEQVSSMSQQALKDIGIKMGHIMKIQKAKVPPRPPA